MSWTADGRTFTVWNPDQMEKEQLPNTFKHSNFASFVRQLSSQLMAQASRRRGSMRIGVRSRMAVAS